MIIPIRCFTCNKILANKSEIFESLREKNKNVDIQEIWRILDINNDCCKSIFLSTVNALDIINLYNSYKPKSEIQNINDQYNIFSTD